MDLRRIRSSFHTSSDPLSFAIYPLFDSWFKHHCTSFLAISIVDRVDSRCHHCACESSLSSPRETREVAVRRLGFSIFVVCGSLLSFRSNGNSSFTVCNEETSVAVFACS